VSEASPPARTDIAKIVVIGIGAALTVAIIVIVIWSTRPGAVRADVRGRVTIVDVLDDRRITATLEVEKAPLASAECDVSAFDIKGTSVGRLTGVVIGPNTANQRVTTMSVAVLTPLGRATSAQVAACRITRTR
jgi:uncharacterized protein DUF4307